MHYFDSLAAETGIKTCANHHDYINAWLNDNAKKNGVGWAPYPMSLRIVNWIKWNLNGNELSTDAKVSLFEQAIILSRKIEWHLFGNHLFENGKALIFAGAFFKEPKAEKLLKMGIKIVTNQIREQILDDGGHFELSTMYRK